MKTPASQVIQQMDGRTLFQKAMDPTYLPKKVLGSDCQVTASSSHDQMDRWPKTFKFQKEELQKACKSACQTIHSLSEEDKEILNQRAADFGFPVRNLSSAKPVEVLKIVLSACAIAD